MKQHLVLVKHSRQSKARTRLLEDAAVSKNANGIITYFLAFSTIFLTSLNSAFASYTMPSFIV
ncbi:MAG: hypothetical protein ACI9IT_001327 [Glaciecola sp.]|jgi:hypothetical protein